ncbi:MAG: helix-turn-helix domain-containing protein [Dehalococcoidia bacterium]
MNVERRTITVEQAGALLGVSRALAYQMANSGQLPIIRCGHRLLVPLKAFETMLDVAPVASKPQAS